MGYYKESRIIFREDWPNHNVLHELGNNQYLRFDLREFDALMEKNYSNSIEDVVSEKVLDGKAIQRGGNFSAAYRVDKFPSCKNENEELIGFVGCKAYTFDEIAPQHYLCAKSVNQRSNEPEILTILPFAGLPIDQGMKHKFVIDFANIHFTQESNSSRYHHRNTQYLDRLFYRLLEKTQDIFQKHSTPTNEAIAIFLIPNKKNQDNAERLREKIIELGARFEGYSPEELGEECNNPRGRYFDGFETDYDTNLRDWALRHGFWDTHCYLHNSSKLMAAPLSLLI